MVLVSGLRKWAMYILRLYLQLYELGSVVIPLRSTSTPPSLSQPCRTLSPSLSGSFLMIRSQEISMLAAELPLLHLGPCLRIRKVHSGSLFKGYLTVGLLLGLGPPPWPGGTRSEDWLVDDGWVYVATFGAAEFPLGLVGRTGYSSRVHTHELEPALAFQIWTSRSPQC